MIAILLWLSLVEDRTEQINPALSSAVNPASDYGMTNFTMTIMDEQGVPARVVHGKKMVHYPKGDRTDIHMPEILFMENQKDTWVITSKLARTRGQGELIKLRGNVVITQETSDEIKLETSKLNINTENSTAYTDKAVKIASPHGETNSVGLHATLKDETINLHSKVKGQYDAPPTQ